MTQKSMFKASLLLLTLLNLHHAVAGNGTDRGGGDAVLFDDRVVLADPYLKRSAEEEGLFKCPEGTRGDLKPELRAELYRIGRVLVGYGAYQGRNYFDSNFIQDHVLHVDAAYCFVDELPRRENRLPINLPMDANGDESVGYTEGRFTFLKSSLFQKMTLREQGKTIVHERLHSAVGNIKYGPITDVTNGLETALSLYNEQVQGKTPSVSTEELKKLRKLRATLVDTGLAPEMDSRIYPNGGALISIASQIDPSAYIGVGSMLLANSAVGPDSVILNSTLLSYGGVSVRLGAGVRIVNSNVGDPVDFGALASAQSSLRYWSRENIDYKLSMDGGSKIIRTIINFNHGDEFNHGTKFVWTGLLSLQESARIENTHIQMTIATLGKNAHLMDLSGVVFGSNNDGLNLRMKDESTFVGMGTHLESGYMSGVDIFGRERQVYYGINSEEALPLLEIAKGVRILLPNVDLSKNGDCKAHPASVRFRGHTILQSDNASNDLYGCF